MAAPAQPSPAGPIRFSTDAFTERERLTAWRDTFGRAFAKLDIEPLPQVRFHSRIDIWVMPDLAIVSGTGAMRTTARTRALVADGNDSLVLHIASCAGRASQLGREVEVEADDAVVLSTSDLGTFTFAAEQSILALNVPRATLGPFLHDPDAVLVRAVPKDSAALRLLRSYVAFIEREPAATADEHVRRLAAAHVHDLVALTVGATPDAAEIARTRGVRAARLGAAKTYLMRHLGGFDLSTASVAAHLGVTPRYIHMLFETEGVSFTQFVLAARLARAHRMLSAPRHAGETISAIAYAAGFADLSHFNRAFRRRYGCTPSDVRVATRRETNGRPA